MKTLVCVGNSHLAAVARGASLASVTVAAVPMSVWNEGGQKERRPRDDVWAAVLSAVSEHRAGRVFAFVGGGAHAILGLAQSPQPFDFLFPEQSDGWLEDVALLPYDVIHALMLSQTRRHLRQLAALAKLGYPVVQSEPPPPVPDNDFLARISATAFPTIEEYGISPPALRHKLWLLHSRIYANFCRVHGITYVRNPPEVFDEDGFLRREYWGDFVHGNAQYGAALLVHLKEMA